MILKKIHYCWFGGSEMPHLNEACLKTWKILEGYEIKRWDETNCPMNAFVQYHLEQKNWAFVSDYVRLYALYTEGGIYLDTDFEVLKPFDLLLDNEGFVAYEAEERINNAIAGSIVGNVFFKDCMEYMLRRFEENQTYQISPVVTTNVMRSKNYAITVYDSEYFYPYNPYDSSKNIKTLMISMITENTYAIHHWAKSWESVSDTKNEQGTGLCVLAKKIVDFIKTNKVKN